jgi:hypothetical protein
MFLPSAGEFPLAAHEGRGGKVSQPGARVSFPIYVPEFRRQYSIMWAPNSRVWVEKLDESHLDC